MEHNQLIMIVLEIETRSHIFCGPHETHLLHFPRGCGVAAIGVAFEVVTCAVDTPVLLRYLEYIDCLRDTPLLASERERGSA